MPDNNHALVPFGKYKGEPVEALVAGEDYCQWLCSQPWFKTKFSKDISTKREWIDRQKPEIGS